MAMNPDAKKAALEFLERHESTAVDLLINGLTDGKIDITKAIDEIKNETADGVELLKITLDVIENPELEILEEDMYE